MNTGLLNTCSNIDFGSFLTQKVTDCSFSCSVVISLSDHLQIIFEWFDHKTFRILCCPSPERNVNTRCSNAVIIPFSLLYFFTSWKRRTGRTGSENLVEGILARYRRETLLFPKWTMLNIYITPSLRPHLLIQPVQWAGHLLRVKLTC